MRPISKKNKDIINSDPYYRECARKNSDCDGRITIEHSIIFAGKQLDKIWSLIPLCTYHHAVDEYQDGGDCNKEINKWIALNRATDQELQEISRAVNYKHLRDYLNDKYKYKTPVSRHWLGKKQSEETKIKRSNAMMEVLKGALPKNLQQGYYRNNKQGWYLIGNKEIFFRSKWEANYAIYLNFLIGQKEIKKWEFESDRFVFEKIKFGTRSYLPDFKIFNNDGSIEYHEVKGWMDAKSKTKIKRMAKYYPKIKLIIIDKEVYQDIKKKLGRMLKFYE